MSMTSITFTIDTHYQGVREEVELWVPPYEELTPEDYDLGYVPERRYGEGSVSLWTRYDDEAWPIEPTPSELISELAGAVGYLNYGKSTTGPFAHGPDQDYLLSLEKKEVDEYCEAYEKWVEMTEDTTDIYEPSYFSEYMGSVAKLDKDNKGFKMMKKMGWNGEGLGKSSSGIEEPVHVDCANITKDNTGAPKKFTPEMLLQVQELNHEFNMNWNEPQSSDSWWEDMEIPDTTETVELIRSGDNHGVGKCRLGGVYIPNGVVRHLINMGCGKGSKFTANLVFTGGKFPWKIGYNGVVRIEEH
jgi:hypothetical protein